MKRVIARCPNCGVEHDDARIVDCEVCGTTLRNWCRAHSQKIGWLDGPRCPGCAEELAARSRPTRPPPPPPTRAPAPPPAPPRRRRTRPPAERPYAPEKEPRYPGRDPREVMLERAEELRPYVASGAGLAVRLFRALFAVVRYVIVLALLGGIVGGVFAYQQRGDLVWPVITGALIGGGLGLFIGLIVAIRILFSE